MIDLLQNLLQKILRLLATRAESRRIGAIRAYFQGYGRRRGVQKARENQSPKLICYNKKIK